MNFMLGVADIKEGESSFRPMIKKIILRVIVFIVVAVSTAFFVNKLNNVKILRAFRHKKGEELNFTFYKKVITKQLFQ